MTPGGILMEYRQLGRNVVQQAPSELYDLAKDPAEERNFFAAHRDVAEQLHEKHLTLLRAVGTPGDVIRLGEPVE